MITHWEEFQSGPHIKNRERLHITLNHRGMILLNRKAFDALKRPEAVVLLFDKVNSKIGIRGANPRLANAFPVARKGKNAHSLIYASTFCRHYGIEIDRTVAFPDVAKGEDGMLELDLRRTVSVGRRRGQ